MYNNLGRLLAVAQPDEALTILDAGIQKVGQLNLDEESRLLAEGVLLENTVRRF